MSETTERKRTQDGSSGADGVAPPVDKQPKTEQQRPERYDHWRFDRLAKYVMVVAVPWECGYDTTCILIPQDELTAKARKLLHRVAGTFCFSHRDMSKDKTGLLVTIHLLCERDYERTRKDVESYCGADTLRREMNTDRWFWCGEDEGRILRESTGATVVDAVFVRSEDDPDGRP
jgi:hypothetical protein